MAEKTVQIEDMITVGDLAKKLDIPVTSLMTEMMKSGIMATLNDKVDFDTAQLVVAEIDEEMTLEKAEPKVAKAHDRKKRDLSDKAADRPPVVAVMGHVDHGKTSLLDAIRESDQADNEAGGITQHISAYQIDHNKRKITFLDTPGHEAFAALREHGAQLTDVAIIVVAADDGIKPQTKEAIRFAKQAGVKILVAINKIDKAGSNVDQVKQQLSDENLLIEEWGGDIVAVEVSAKTKENIDKLLDMVLLVADVEELKAETGGPAEGLVIEAHMEKGKGSVATALVEHGVLKPGMSIAAGSAVAKVRTLSDTSGKPIKEAGASTPVVITGFKQLPHFGDLFKAHKDEKTARVAAEEHAVNIKENGGRNLDMTGGDLIKMINKDQGSKELKVIVRADVQGSLKSVVDSLSTLENEEISVRVVGSGVGSISESDVSMAESSGAIIYGFNVSIPVNVKKFAGRNEVVVKVYNVIYELIDDVKLELEKMLPPEIIETEVGRLIVKGVFRTTRNEVIAGGEVTKGKAKPGVLAKVMRDDEEIAEVTISKVQRTQQEAKEVLKGEMCGLEIQTENKVMLKEGDKIEFFTRETKARKL